MFGVAIVLVARSAIIVQSYPLRGGLLPNWLGGRGGDAGVEGMGGRPCDPRGDVRCLGASLGSVCWLREPGVCGSGRGLLRFGGCPAPQALVAGGRCVCALGA